MQAAPLTTFPMSSPQRGASPLITHLLQAAKSNPEVKDGPAVFGIPFPKGLAAQNPAFQLMALQQIAMDFSPHIREETGIDQHEVFVPEYPVVDNRITPPHQDSSHLKKSITISSNPMKNPIQKEHSGHLDDNQKTTHQSTYTSSPNTHGACEDQVAVLCEEKPSRDESKTNSTTVTNRYVILPGGMFAKPKDVFVESLGGGIGRQNGGCLAMVGTIENW